VLPSNGQYTTDEITQSCGKSKACRNCRVGNAVEQIQLGKQDVVFAGGGEEEHWSMSSLLMPWARFQQNITLLPNKPLVPIMQTVMDLLLLAAAWS
jgi:acetyl-CoA acetyltransferase